MSQNRLKRPPWRTIVPGCALLLAVILGYALWSPGKDIRDGRHDRGQNAIWISHGWLGGDDWFEENNKTASISTFREPEAIRRLADKLRSHHITDVYPHLCPSGMDGSLPPVDPQQVERFLDEFEGFQVIPWVGGPLGSHARPKDEKWREAFVDSVGELLVKHPRLAGVQVNIEPLPSGDEHFVVLLEDLREAVGREKILSVAAYPPPTRWHQFEDVHWDETYTRKVARRCDQLAVMMYDTANRNSKIYQWVMASWTEELLDWSEGKALLLGIPTYADVGVEYHNPEIENLHNGLLGIHAGLARNPIPDNYQGVAIYCEWETDDQEWAYFREHFLNLD